MLERTPNLDLVELQKIIKQKLCDFEFNDTQIDELLKRLDEFGFTGKRENHMDDVCRCESDLVQFIDDDIYVAVAQERLSEIEPFFPNTRIEPEPEPEYGGLR